MTDVQIEELPIPAALDGSPTARDFIDAVNVGNDVLEAAIGTPDLGHQPAEVLPAWKDLAKEPKRMLVVRADARIVAAGSMEWRTEGDAASESWQELSVLPAYQGRGIGRALADHMEATARAEGRSRIITRPHSTEGPGPRLEPRSGWGSVPSGNREVRFLHQRGYVFEQITRMSRIPLPVDPAVLDEHLARAQEKAGDDYRLVYWGDRVPEEWREDFALLMTRLADDVPLAGVPLPGLGDQSAWTVERIVEEEERALAGPNRALNIAVEHIPTGRLAGFTTLFVPPETDRAVGQGATLVIAEHRGHRLSMLLKIANFQNLEREYPGHPSIVTGNAEENRFMLDVNEALGFVPVVANGVWTKLL